MFDAPVQTVGDEERHPGGAAPAPGPADESILLDAYSAAIIDVVERVGPAVARVDTRRGNRNRGGTGSGVILSPDGLIGQPNLAGSGDHVAVGQDQAVRRYHDAGTGSRARAGPFRRRRMDG